MITLFSWFWYHNEEHHWLYHRRSLCDPGHISQSTWGCPTFKSLSPGLLVLSSFLGLPLLFQAPCSDSSLSPPWLLFIFQERIRKLGTQEDIWPFLFSSPYSEILLKSHCLTANGLASVQLNDLKWTHLVFKFSEIQNNFCHCTNDPTISSIRCSLIYTPKSLLSLWCSQEIWGYYVNTLYLGICKFIGYSPNSGTKL